MKTLLGCWLRVLIPGRKPCLLWVSVSHRGGRVIDVVLSSQLATIIRDVRCPRALQFRRLLRCCFMYGGHCFQLYCGSDQPVARPTFGPARGHGYADVLYASAWTWGALVMWCVSCNVMCVAPWPFAKGIRQVISRSLKLWGASGMLFSSLTAVDWPSRLLGDPSRRRCCLLLPDLCKRVLREPGLAERCVLSVMPLEFMCNESSLSVQDIPGSRVHSHWLWFLMVFFDHKGEMPSWLQQAIQPCSQYNTIQYSRIKYNTIKWLLWRCSSFVPWNSPLQSS